jgi:hypothetical protein
MSRIDTKAAPFVALALLLLLPVAFAVVVVGMLVGAALR